MAQLPARTISSKLKYATAIPGIGAVVLILLAALIPSSILKDSDRDKIRDSGVSALIAAALGFGVGYRKEETAYFSGEIQETEVGAEEEGDRQ